MTREPRDVVAEALDGGHGTPEDELGAADAALEALHDEGYRVVGLRELRIVAAATAFASALIGAALAVLL